MDFEICYVKIWVIQENDQREKICCRRLLNLPPELAASMTSDDIPNCCIKGPSWPDCNAALNMPKAYSNNKEDKLNDKICNNKTDLLK